MCLRLLFLLFFVGSPMSWAQKTPLERRIEQQGLVDVRSVDSTIFVSLMYARADNFTGRILYHDLHTAYLLPETARALCKAQTELQRRHPDLSLKVYDATRPMSVQQHMWDVVKGTNRSIYVSNPARGGGLHNYGLAVDITLCWRRNVYDRSGRLLHAAGDTTGLSMGTPIDYLGKLAHVRDETAHFRKGRLTRQNLTRRRLLREVMAAGGFKVLPTEWWHFNFKTRAEVRAHYHPIR